MKQPPAVEITTDRGNSGKLDEAPGSNPVADCRLTLQQNAAISFTLW
jgi:hypothetical protein